MKISVITVCFNAERTIARCIESFLAQEFPNRELIIVDGASTDGTCDVIRRYDSPLIHLVSEPDHGIYDAMNKGLARISGDAFGFLNADDCYRTPRALSLIAAALDHADLASGGLNFVRRHDGSPPARIWRPTRFSAGAYRRGFSLPHPTTYARRDVLRQTGPFAPVFGVAADYDWMLRALELHNLRHAVIDEVLVDMLIGGQSTAGLSAIVTNSRRMLDVRRVRLGSGIVDAALFINLFHKARQVLSARLAASGRTIRS